MQIWQNKCKNIESSLEPMNQALKHLFDGNLRLRWRVQMNSFHLFVSFHVWVIVEPIYSALSIQCSTSSLMLTFHNFRFTSFSLCEFFLSMFFHFLVFPLHCDFLSFDSLSSAGLQFLMNLLICCFSYLGLLHLFLSSCDSFFRFAVFSSAFVSRVCSFLTDSLFMA